MPEVQVVTTYLEMTDRDQLRPRLSEDPALRLRHVTDCPPHVYRDLYRGVGRDFNWYSRYHWTDAQIAANLADPAVRLHVLYHEDAPAGFFELRCHPADDSVEILFLGLLPAYTGRGLGRHLVTCALREAWRLDPARVWLHTCSLDHPAALATYRAAGLAAYKTTAGVEPLLQP
jgi:GNAT superfamily N-acetyltransferase